MPMVKDERRQRSTLATRCSQLARNSPSSNRLCFSVSRCCSTLILSTPTRHSQRADVIEVSTGSGRLRRPTSVGGAIPGRARNSIHRWCCPHNPLARTSSLPAMGGRREGDFGIRQRRVGYYGPCCQRRGWPGAAGCVAQATVESHNLRIVLADFRARRRMHALKIDC